MTRSLLLLLVCSVSVVAQPAAKKASTKWTIDKVLFTESARDVQLSPDGTQAVWVKSAMDEESGESVSHLFRSTAGRKKDLQLTRGAESCRAPRWSPDGQWIAFVSKRPTNEPEKPEKRRMGGRRADKEKDEPAEQIWLLDASGGEPWQLTKGDRKVAAYAWAGNDALLFLAQEDRALFEKERKEKLKDDSAVVDDEKFEPPVRLFKVEIESKKVTRLTENTDRILSFAASRDGKRVAAVHGTSLSYEYDQKTKPQVLLHDLEKNESRRIFKDARYNLTATHWSLDGKGFYATSQHTSSPRYVHAFITELYWFDLATATERKIDLGWERGLALQPINDYREGLIVTPDGFIALLCDGVHFKAARFTQDKEQKWKREWLTGEHAAQIFGLSANCDGKVIAYAHTTAASPPQWYRARLDGVALKQPEALAVLNEPLRELPMAKVEVVRWKGALDKEVEGLLYYPIDYKAGGKYPLVAMLHGGPYGADYDAWDDSWAYPAHLVAQRGAFVFKPNYHGSSDYGLAFAESIANGKYYELPLDDIDKGVDALIARGLVDPAKLATIGWSNGAILSAALIVKSQRWKAAALGAGGAEWVADWGACEFGMSFSNYYFGKSPLEDPQLYMKMAPLYQFDKVRTPTIIFQGDADRSVPPHHAWAQFRTLQQLGKTDVRLLFFPGEPHSLEKLAHQRRKLTEELAWLDKYLFASQKELNLALKSDSPLARTLKLREVKRDGERYGERRQEVLVPETVPFEGLQIGRFEVTQAQYAEFDKAYKIEPGKENYPAAGIPFAKAKAYCEWLSKRLGETYRLPDEEEGEKLYDERETKGQNTLDWWAGYELNPDDARRLREKLRELPGKAPLLREVGRFKGEGEGDEIDKEQSVFDLAGNAAEWVENKGMGKARGGCAACPADEKAGRAEPPAEYVGFRVVKVGKK